ncbi:PKD domain-containing protein [Flavihumibacter rivuli]|uniref:PKD domain-containing protein n=1 Tax=Flavihumibacter rivuli TaxID=2838156 RepID=UPI001BDE5D93|nr:PKD domain-containing protein [Flavihumibacter rivuli]ULQ57319.1 PKD domain-containing protein [Flavihumibacter rivuli]
MKSLILLSLAASFFTNDPVKGNKEGKVDNPAKNQAPVANAGGKLVFKVSDFAALDGTASREPDGIIARYQWTQVAGSPVQIANPSAAITGLSNIKKGEYVFRLTVIDEKGAVATDDVKLVVTE